MTKAQIAAAAAAQTAAPVAVAAAPASNIVSLRTATVAGVRYIIFTSDITKPGITPVSKPVAVEAWEEIPDTLAFEAALATMAPLKGNYLVAATLPNAAGKIYGNLHPVQA